jgi:hypothetical protein
MLMPIVFRQQAKDIRSEQSALRDLVRCQPYCLCAHRAHRCARDVCPRGEECAGNIRQTLHTLLYGTLANFTHQDQAMRVLAPAPHYLQHTEAHADITEALTALVVGYSETEDMAGTLEGIDRVIERIQRHIETLDAELIGLLNS